jgi:hypothetical protein
MSQLDMRRKKIYQISCSVIVPIGTSAAVERNHLNPEARIETLGRAGT